MRLLTQSCSLRLASGTPWLPACTRTSRSTSTGEQQTAPWQLGASAVYARSYHPQPLLKTSHLHPQNMLYILDLYTTTTTTQFAYSLEQHRAPLTKKLRVARCCTSVFPPSPPCRYDTRRDLRLPADAPVIGLVLQRSHLVTGDEGHYSGVVSELEARGECSPVRGQQQRTDCSCCDSCDFSGENPSTHQAF